MSIPDAKIVYLTAGAAGMFCGSCLHDNALVRALAEQGWDIQLVPTYTPIRTDEANVSIDHVLFGGLNVYLQQRIPLFRYLPSILDRFLDNPRLIRRVTAKAIDTDAALLGGLALSMLQGSHGNQRKEVRRMCRWLKQEKPDLLILTNLLIGGCLEQIKRDLNVPVLVTLQGDDVFLDSLSSPFREKCMTQIKKLVPLVDGFIVHSEFFRESMSDYFEIDPTKIYLTPLGLDLRDYQRFLPGAQQPTQKPHRTIGYLARLAPEKGLQNLVEAFIQLKQRAAFADLKLLVAGWLGPPNLDFAQSQWDRLNSAGLQSEYSYLGAVERAAKLDFLAEIDVLSVPTKYREPKGLYALEAMAAGIPIVVPDHGTFPELIAQSGGGLLFNAENLASLTATLSAILDDVDLRKQLGRDGLNYVHQFRNSVSMATSTGELIKRFLI